MRRRSPPLLPLLLLGLALVGAGCEAQPLTVTVIGDSHSDMDRDPRFDWERWVAPSWTINEHATRGLTCRRAVVGALEAPEALVGDVMVIFCGTNDAGNGWDLEVTLGWIQAAIDQGLGHGDPVVVVAPPPALSDMTVPAALRNQRLSDLRDAIYGLQATYDIEVADVWNAIYMAPVFETQFAEDGLHLSYGGQTTAHNEIRDAIDRALD